MKLQIGFAIIAGFALLGCSARNDQNAKNEPLSIDRTQIDLSESDPYSWPLSQRTNWHCTLLAKTGPEDDEVRWKRLNAMHGKLVKITDGREILATGQIAAVTSSQGRYLGPAIALPSLEVAEELYRKLGFRERLAP